jgi:hypothetical protein
MIRSEHKHGPVIAIGGVGGSGTRVVAKLLRDAGVFMGSDLNSAEDNLAFTLLFKFREVLAFDDTAFATHYDIFRACLNGSPQAVSAQMRQRLLSADRLDQHPEPWLLERLRHLETGSEPQIAQSAMRGWKEPNTHIILDRIIATEPELRYIHVIRNGLDMAVSGNRNQVRLWGGLIPGTEPDDSPHGSLRYWCAANARALAFAARLGPRHLVVNYDQLGANPETEVRRILSFAGKDVDDGFIKACADEVVPKPHRSQHLSLKQFDQRDIEYVRSFGFLVASA